jgi:hypothetical protein
MTGQSVTEDSPATGEASHGDAAASASETADGAIVAEATGEATAEAPVDEAVAAEAETATDTSSDEGAAFLAALTEAMQATAAAEKARIMAEMDDRRHALIADVRARQEADATRLREFADDALTGIDSWATAERDRIQAERERRAQVVRADLELTLTQHGVKVDREIAVVESAITAYRADVEAFFTNIEREAPLAVTQQAGRRPIFPSIETIGSSETAEATRTAAPASVGVMDPNSPAQPIGSWRAWTEMSASADAAGAVPPPPAIETPEADDASAEPVQVPVASGYHPPAEETLVHALPVSRPMSWLRRDHQNDDPSS